MKMMTISSAALTYSATDRQTVLFKSLLLYFLSHLHIGSYDSFYMYFIAGREHLHCFVCPSPICLVEVVLIVNSQGSFTIIFKLKHMVINTEFILLNYRHRNRKIMHKFERKGENSSKACINCKSQQTRNWKTTETSQKFQQNYITGKYLH